MTAPILLTLAYALDLAIGDPRQIPHPVRIIGRAIEVMEKYLRNIFKGDKGEKRAGVILVAAIVSITFLVSLIIEKTLLAHWSSTFSRYLTSIIYICFVSTTLATHELIRSAGSVIDSLMNKNIQDARAGLSLIVGRETKSLDQKEISMATIETLAENAADGIIAPIFYFAIGGLPLAMTYKAVNTMDSMVGYKNDRYRNFGLAAAKLDDIANYIPARITGLLIVVSDTILSVINKKRLKGPGAFKTMLRDGRNHSSPNSGIPEAAMAGALGVRLGGPSTYEGTVVEKPYIGDEVQNTDYMHASKESLTLTKFTSLFGLLCALTFMGLWK